APVAAPAAAAPAPAPARTPAVTAMPATTIPSTGPSGVAAPVKAAPSSATAELEKAEPDHAKARRFARVAVSEIKLYHEEEVKAGRAAKDLWKRLNQDIMMSIQTYEKRVPAEVRQRFDYLYDELVRQLAEGNRELLGPDAPDSTAKAAPLKR
ncbi:MAG: arylesterase-related protein, partial [Labilithrix sp.]|nr:arylesterase-related protein [Labilithrix sp.]